MIGEWITARDFAVLAGVKVTTIHRYHASGRIPKAEKYAGQSPMWRRAVADEWVRTRRPRGRPKSS